MAKSKHTKTHNIFLLNPERVPYLPSNKGLDIKESLSAIMKRDETYRVQELIENIDTKGFNVMLFFRGEDNYQSKFASFCKAFVKSDQEAVSYIPRSASSVLFIWNDNHIFAVTTGQGYRMIEEYAVPKFGMIVTSIFKDKFKVTSLDSNAMSSIVHSTKTVYSNEVDFIDINALDTIFKEVTGRLNDPTNVKSLLNLDKKSKKRSMKITAKNYVQFSSALCFDGLLHLLAIIDSFDFKQKKDRFNLISPINPKKNREIIAQINATISERIYFAIKNKKEIPFDIFHKNTNAFIESDTYIIEDTENNTEYYRFDDYLSSEALEKAYIAFLGGNADSESAFTLFLNSIDIRATKGDYTQTVGKFYDHISGEVTVNQVNYYIFYGEFYRQNEAYSARLDDALRNKLRLEFYTEEIKTKWIHGKNEDWFNNEVSEKENFIHLHRVIPDNIEFADLIKFDNDEVTIVHVKDGFDCDMRALDRQVEMSITKVLDIKHNNNTSYLSELYTKASAHNVGKNITSVFPTEEQFLACIREKNVRYVIVVRPAEKELLKNTSNIAKHCLNALMVRCFNQGIQLFIQIK